jgi:uncharacterized protein (DUF362 family)
VQSVVQRLLDEGAHVIVGDNSGEIGVGTAERVARVAGVYDASLGCFQDISRETVQVSLAQSRVQRVTYSRIALEADHIVSLPKLKTHLQTQITGAIKNSFGLLVGREKTRLHTLRPRPAEFVEAVVDVFLLRPPTVHIVDAIQGMEGNGPSGGQVRDIGVILASADAARIDEAIALIMGRRPSELLFLREMKKRGLWDDRVPLPIDGDLPRIPDFITPDTFSQGLRGTLLNRIGFRLAPSRARLKVDRQRCTLCRTCEKGCPVQAIILDARQQFDRSACISCFCCAEFCPEGAIQTRPMLRTRLKRWVRGVRGGESG